MHLNYVGLKPVIVFSKQKKTWSTWPAGSQSRIKHSDFE